MLEVLGGIAFGAVVVTPAVALGAHVARNSPSPRARRAGDAVDRAVRHPVATVKTVPAAARRAATGVPGRTRSAAAAVRRRASLAGVTGFTAPGAPRAPRRDPLPPRPPAAATTTPARPSGSRPRPHLMPVPDRKEPVVTTPSQTRTPPVAADGADLFTAMTALTARGRAGGMPHKRQVIGVMAEGFDYQAQALLAFAREMQDKGYGAPVWEGLERAAAHLAAASSSCGESTSAMNAMASMTIGEASESSVQVPHNSELNVS